MGFSRQECWSGVPFPSPGDPDPGIEPRSPTFQADSLPAGLPGKPKNTEWVAYPWRRQWHPTPVLLPGKSHGWRSLVGYSPWGREESDTTEQLHFPFSLSCIGEGNGNPHQCSCLENPRDSGAWWAAVCGVAQSWTRLTQLSSSSSSSCVTVAKILTGYALLLLLLSHFSRVQLCATP